MRRIPEGRDGPCGVETEIDGVQTEKEAGACEGGRDMRGWGKGHVKIYL